MRSLSIALLTKLFMTAAALCALAASAQSPSATGTNMMLTGQILRSANGDYLVSSNKAFVLIMQSDGNLCEYFGSSPATMKPGAIWCSNTRGDGVRFSAQMHSTNNFCVTTGDEWGQGPALWCTNQIGVGKGPAFAMLNGDGNFFIQQGTPSAPAAFLWQTGNVFSQVAITAPSGGSIRWPDGAVCPGICAEVLRVGSNVSLTALPPAHTSGQRWSGACSGTGNPCNFTVAAGGQQNVGVTFNQPWPTANGTTQLAAGQVLYLKESIHSPDGHYGLMLEGNGNLVETLDGQPVPTGYTSGSSISGGAGFATTVTEARLCVYPGNPGDNLPHAWCSPPAFGAGQFALSVQDDGDVVMRVLTAGNVVAWNTGAFTPMTFNVNGPSGAAIAIPGSLCTATCTRSYRIGSVFDITTNPSVAGRDFRRWTGTVPGPKPGNPCAITNSATPNVCGIVVAAGSTPITAEYWGPKVAISNTIVDMTGAQTTWSLWIDPRVPRGVVSACASPKGCGPLTWEPKNGLVIFDNGFIRLASNPTQCIGLVDVNYPAVVTCDATDNSQTGWTYSKRLLTNTTRPGMCLLNVTEPSGYEQEVGAQLAVCDLMNFNAGQYAYLTAYQAWILTTY